MLIQVPSATTLIPESYGWRHLQWDMVQKLNLKMPESEHHLLVNVAVLFDKPRDAPLENNKK